MLLGVELDVVQDVDPEPDVGLAQGEVLVCMVQEDELEPVLSVERSELGLSVLDNVQGKLLRNCR